MKKLIVLLIAVVFTGFITSFSLQQITNSKKVPLNVQITESKPVNLDFTNADVRLEGWDENYIQITQRIAISDAEYEKRFGKKHTLSTLENQVKLENFTKPSSCVYNFQTWMSLLQFERYKNSLIGQFENNMSESLTIENGTKDFEILVPQNTPIHITATNFKANNCTIISSKANSAVIKDCNISKNFVSEGDYIRLKDCTINKQRTFKNKTVEMDDNKNID